MGLSTSSLLTRLFGCWRPPTAPPRAPCLPPDQWGGVARGAALAPAGQGLVPPGVAVHAPRPALLSLDALRRRVQMWHERQGSGLMVGLLEAAQEPDYTLYAFVQHCVRLQVSPELQEAALPAVRALLALRDAPQRETLLTQLATRVLHSDGQQRDAFLALMEREAGAKPGVLAAHLAVVLEGQGALLEHPHVRHTLAHRSVQHDARVLSALLHGVHGWSEEGGAESLADWLAWPSHNVLAALLAARIHAHQEVCEPLLQALDTPPSEPAPRSLLAALRDLQDLALVRAAHARAVQSMLPSFSATRALDCYRDPAHDDTARLQRWLRQVDRATPDLRLAEKVDLHTPSYDAAGRQALARAMQGAPALVRAMLSLLQHHATLRHGLARPAERSAVEPQLFGAGAGAEGAALQRFYAAEVAPMQRLLMQVGPGLMRFHGERLGDYLNSAAHLQPLLCAWLFPREGGTPDFVARFERFLGSLRDPGVLYRYVAWIDKMEARATPQVLREVSLAQVMGRWHAYRHEHSPQLQHALKRAGRGGPALRAAWEAGAESPAHTVLATSLPRGWQLQDTATLDSFLHGGVDLDTCQNPLRENHNNAGLVGRMSDGSKRQLVVVDERGVQQARAMFRLLTPQRGRPVLLVSVPYVAPSRSEAHKRDLNAVLWRFAHARAQALGLQCLRGTCFAWPGLPRVAAASQKLMARPSAAPDYWDEREGAGLWANAVEVYVTNQGRPT